MLYVTHRITILRQTRFSIFFFALITRAKIPLRLKSLDFLIYRRGCSLYFLAQPITTSAYQPDRRYFQNKIMSGNKRHGGDNLMKMKSNLCQDGAFDTPDPLVG